MKYRRKQQLTIILILVAVISTISVGFAAFSSTLNISSSANVTPNSDDFSVVFSSSQYAITTRDDDGTVVNGIGTYGAQGGITNLYKTSASGLIAEFTEPGNKLDITIYAHNIGEYDAYLRGVNITNVDGSSYKKCTGESDTTDSLVQAACDGISLSINIGGIDYEYGSTIANHTLSKGSVEPIIITVAYNSNASRADGNFDILFGDISLEYSTVDNSKQLISFTVDGLEFSAEEGMTWAEFITSSYNTNNVFTQPSKIFYNEKLLYDEVDYNKVDPSNNIIHNMSYTTDNS